MYAIRRVVPALAALAALGAVPASASAVKTTLVLKEEKGGPLATGASIGMYVEFPLAECVVEGSAVVSVNSAKRDILDKPLSATLCNDSETSGGAIQEVQLSVYGKATIVAAPGSPLLINPYLEGCVYEFKKLTGTLETPGEAVISGESKGKLSKTHTTATGCEQRLITEFSAVLELESELVKA